MSKLYDINWISVKDRLPEKGRQVVVMTTERFWNTPEGVPDAHITATGYLAGTEHDQYWSIFGERGMEIASFTHWMYLDTPEGKVNE